MTQADDAARGVRVAQEAVRAIATGNEQAVVDMLNGASHADAANAAAYLVSALREVYRDLHRGNPTKVARALRAAADRMEDDVIYTYIEVETHKKGDDHG